jgi:KDO2-lipid IV(A) lauroyltransferase
MRLRLIFRRFLSALEAVPIWAGLGLFKLLPRRAAAAIGAWVARGVGPLLPLSRVARRNLELCFPEKSAAERTALLRAMWDNLGRNAGDFTHRRALWDPSLRERAYQFGEVPLREAARRAERVTIKGERIEVVGAEQFRVLLDGARPALLFTAHMGNWEMLPWVAARMDMKLSVVYRRPNNPLIARAIEGRREGHVEFLPKGMQGAFGAARVMDRGGCLAMLVDVKENKGVAVPFFGRPAMTGTAMAILALRYDAALHGVYALRLGQGRSRITLEPALDVPRTGDAQQDVRAIMTAINARVETWVRANPEQWLWVHRRWPKEVYE